MDVRCGGQAGVVAWRMSVARIRALMVDDDNDCSIARRPGLTGKSDGRLTGGSRPMWRRAAASSRRRRRSTW